MSKRPRRLRITVALLVAAAALVKSFQMQPPISGMMSSDMLTSYLYVAAFLAWGASMRARLLPSPMRTCAMGTAWCMVACIIVRCFKWHATYFLPEVERLCWYAYYPLLLALAGLLFAGCAHIAMRGDRLRVRRSVALAAACVAIVSLTIMTNDLHQWAFRFDDGIPDEHAAYSLGLAYWAVIALIAAFLVSSIMWLARASRRAQMRWRLAAPFAIIVVTFAYLLALDGVIRPLLLRFNLEAPFFFSETCCIAALLVWEWLVHCGLVPSNDRYGELFAAMDAPALVTDADLNGAYATALPLAATRSQLEAALNHPVMIDAGTELHSVPIRAGHVFWAADVAELARVREQLEEVAEQLAERNEVISAENELAERRERIAARARVYAQAEALVSDDLEAMRAEVARMQATGCAPSDELLALAVRLAFVKRAMNLRLSAAEGKRASAEDVWACLNEMMRCLKHAGVKCLAACAGDAEIDGGKAIEALRMFARVAGELHGRMHALLATVDAASSSLKLVVEPRASDQDDGLQFIVEDLSRLGVSATIEDGAVYARIALDCEGDAA